VPRQNSIQKMNNSWDDQSDDDADAFWKTDGGAEAVGADSGEGTGGKRRFGRKKQEGTADDA
jgi:hypothetical protein